MENGSWQRSKKSWRSGSKPRPDIHCKLDSSLAAGRKKGGLAITQLLCSSFRIDNLIFSGPTNITKHRLTHNEFEIRWTPVEDDLGDYYPICFAVESVKK
ncbi:hypothetical protein CHARACLAT_030614 [Characodon lateralis]|uniref:Uncharacterized protein n=1 Tax=Characodon lateralis TaxID=208331 RepID=A0ABU7EE71_9TELE|nr:hypothetical protein [Characodon lateralis]